VISAPSAKGRQGPAGWAVGFAAAAAGLVFEAFDLWKDARFVAVLAVLGAIVCVVCALYNLVAASSHQATRLDVQGLAWPGGTLVAVLRAPGLRGARQLSATLACRQAVDKAFQATAREERYQEETIWSQQATFPVVVRQGRSESRIEFAIPPHLAPTTVEVGFGDEAKGEGILWELAIEARGVGMDLKRRFIVPVGPRPAANPASKMAA
jgi:hypothetical protein